MPQGTSAALVATLKKAEPPCGLLVRRRLRKSRGCEGETVTAKVVALRVMATPDGPKCWSLRVKRRLQPPFDERKESARFHYS